MTSRHKVTTPPTPAIRPQSRIVHGVALNDDYAWLRAENWREVLRDPDALPAEIMAHIEAENAWCDTLMAPTKALQRELIKEMRGRIKEDDSEPPQPDGPFLYYSRYRRGGEHPLICRKPRSGTGGKPGREQVMLDTDALSEGKEFFDLGDAEHSPDHRLLAWSADEAGSELYLIRVRDLTIGEDLPDVIADTSGEMIWAADSSAFVYVALDHDHRPTRVLRHRLGTPQSEDELLYEETDPGLFADIDQTQSRRFLLISSSDHETSEVSLVDLQTRPASQG